MRRQSLVRLFWLGVVAVAGPLCALSTHGGTALGTAFTYQGQLKQGGVPYSGTADLEFSLWDGAAAGAQIGATQTKGAQAVANGLFTVQLDFGQSAFDGGARWLEIRARVTGGAGAFETLAPRQRLTPAPHAHFARKAPWSGLLGIPGGFADNVDNDSGGDITAVSAGAGLTGGGSAGSVTLNVGAGTGIVVGGNSVSLAVAYADGSAHDDRFVNESQLAAIGTAMLEDDSVTVAKIAPSVLSSLDGVTHDGGDIDLIAGPGITITPDDAADTITIEALTLAHGHFGETWTGSAPAGLSVETTGSEAGVPYRALFGLASATPGDGPTYGVHGKSVGEAGAGLFGEATAASGTTYGVSGHCTSPDGAGVYGKHVGTGNNGRLGTGLYGVQGASADTAGIGVFGEATGASGAAFGVSGHCTSPDGAGVYGKHVGSGNYGRLGTGLHGVYGEHVGSGNYGRLGTSLHGVYGEHVGSGNYGRLGTSLHGVYGQHAGTGSFGYLGGSTHAVHGKAPAGGHAGYFEGEVRITTDLAVNDDLVVDNDVTVSNDLTVAQGIILGGVRRTTWPIGGGIGVPLDLSGSLPGAILSAENASTGPGVQGHSDLGNGIEGTSGGDTGVRGRHEPTGNFGELGTSGHGVRGWHTPSGNYGELGTSGYGARGRYAANGNDGVLGHEFFGVRGDHGASSNSGALGGPDFGVKGYHMASNNAGLLGTATAAVSGNSETGYGVYGETSSGYAGYFNGPVHVTHDLEAGGIVAGISQFSGFVQMQADLSVTGNVSKGGGSFKIDHPLDPANKYLYHSFVESPDMMNVYNGNITLDKGGEAWVELPKWFEALNRDFRYQLTCIGGFAQVYIAEKVRGNRFKIAGGKPGLEVSWQVTGIRQDAYAKAHRIRVEVDKAEGDRGRYLHPKAHGQPETMAIHRRTMPGLASHQPVRR